MFTKLYIWPLSRRRKSRCLFKINQKTEPLDNNIEDENSSRPFYFNKKKKNGFPPEHLKKTSVIFKFRRKHIISPIILLFFFIPRAVVLESLKSLTRYFPRPQTITAKHDLFIKKKSTMVFITLKLSCFNIYDRRLIQNNLFNIISQQYKRLFSSMTVYRVIQATTFRVKVTTR